MTVTIVNIKNYTSDVISITRCHLKLSYQFILSSTQIKGKESENSYQELKRSQKDRHTQTHENCIEIFRLARPSFSIERE